jgi:hypothetical protein
MRRLRAAAAKRPRWWIPPPIEAWFAGERSIPITALSVPFCGVLDVLWQSWAEVNPGAVRPADWPPTTVSDGERRHALRQLTRYAPKWYGADAPPRHAGKQ